MSFRMGGEAKQVNGQDPEEALKTPLLREAEEDGRGKVFNVGRRLVFRVYLDWFPSR